MGDDGPAAMPLLHLDGAPARPGEWTGQLWKHRAILSILGRSDFHLRYKRASLGILWAVGIPLLQAAVLSFVFGHLLDFEADFAYGPFVLSGLVGWSYFVGAVPAAATSIVDGSGLTDKVWFPRGILALVPCVSGLPGLAVSALILVLATPLLGGSIDHHVLLLLPAAALLIAFTGALSLVLAGLYVAYRDVKFLVTATLLVLFYVTPVMYPADQLGRWGRWLDLNPLTGIVGLFHSAIAPDAGLSGRALVVAIVATIALGGVAVEQHRRGDRTFVDLL